MTGKSHIVSKVYRFNRFPHIFKHYTQFNIQRPNNAMKNSMEIINTAISVSKLLTANHYTL